MKSHKNESKDLHSKEMDKWNNKMQLDCMRSNRSDINEHINSSEAKKVSQRDKCSHKSE